MVRQCKLQKLHVLVTPEEKKIRRQKQLRKRYQDNVRKQIQETTSDQNSDVNLVDHILSEYLSANSDPIEYDAIGIVHENQEHITMKDSIDQSIKKYYEAKEIVGKSGIHITSDIAHAPISSLLEIVQEKGLGSRLPKVFSLANHNDADSSSNDDDSPMNIWLQHRMDKQKSSGK
ncbi:uncharacterized protein A4U43_C04F4360 [Asparagus officinalis]|uniref:Uncharacterized protein n=1 Tax=Asparagus officinalis TaxID=4686 RepID=A0A5P1F0X6_ASPOF|nr:uncharacterized protein A4U43_C04F4360 [Asparagus officinalis]